MHETVKKYTKSLPYSKCLILSSNDENIRFRGSSGGFVTSLLRHFFDEKKIQSAICFEFTGKELFKPKLVFSKNDYIQTGSVYHDMKLVDFVRNNINEIVPPVFITCLPCECRSIKNILKKRNIESVVISPVCSGQLTKQATYDFLKKHKLDISDIKVFSYRGLGWPSGINIEMKNGDKHFFHNVDSDWICFFHSTIYNLEKCLHCKTTYSKDAEFIVADPWFREYIKNEKKGCTVVCTSQKYAQKHIETMLDQKQINLHDEIEFEKLVNSQFWTIAKKESYLKFKLLQRLIWFFRTKFYRNLFLKGNVRYFHTKRWMRLLRKHKRKLYGKNRNH